MIKIHCTHVWNYHRTNKPYSEYNDKRRKLLNIHPERTFTFIMQGYGASVVRQTTARIELGSCMDLNGSCLKSMIYKEELEVNLA